MILDFLFILVIANIASEAILPAIGLEAGFGETAAVLLAARLLGIELRASHFRLPGSHSLERVMGTFFGKLSLLLDHVSNLLLVPYKGDTARNVFLMTLALIAAIVLAGA